MKLSDIVSRVAFGTKLAVRKNGEINHILYDDLPKIEPFVSLLEEKVQCIYVENDELLIDLDKEINL